MRPRSNQRTKAGAEEAYMLKRLIQLVAAAALTLSVAGLAVAVEGPYKFACADITGGGGQLTQSDATPELDFNFGIETAGTCGGNVTFTLYVYNDFESCRTDAAPLVTLTAKGASPTQEVGDTAGQVAFFAPNLTTDDQLWVWGTSGTRRTTYDSAPDLDDPEGGALCVEVQDDSASSGKFR
jgi:hypothetical protein